MQDFFYDGRMKRVHSNLINSFIARVELKENTVVFIRQQQREDVVQQFCHRSQHLPAHPFVLMMENSKICHLPHTAEMKNTSTQASITSFSTTILHKHPYTSTNITIIKKKKIVPSENNPPISHIPNHTHPAPTHPHFVWK